MKKSILTMILLGIFSLFGAGLVGCSVEGEIDPDDGEVEVDVDD